MSGHKCIWICLEWKEIWVKRKHNHSLFWRGIQIRGSKECFSAEHVWLAFFIHERTLPANFLIKTSLFNLPGMVMCKLKLHELKSTTWDKTFLLNWFSFIFFAHEPIALHMQSPWKNNTGIFFPCNSLFWNKLIPLVKFLPHHHQEKVIIVA